MRWQAERSLVAGLILVGCWAARLGAAEPATAVPDRTAPELLAPTTAIYVEAPRAKDLIRLVMQHPLRKQIEELEQVRQAQKTDAYQAFLLSVKVFEESVGAEWQPLAESLLEGGAYAAFDPAANAGVVMIKSGDSARLERTRLVVVNLLRDALLLQGKAEELEERNYRGLLGYRLGDKAVLVTMGPWLVLTNQRATAKEIADRYLDGGEATLARSELFRQARASGGERPIAWAWIDMNVVRQNETLRAAYLDKSENPAGELLVGGVLETLGHAPYATAWLLADEGRVRLSFKTPFDEKWIPEQRKFFFRAAGDKPAVPLTPARTLVNLYAHRDLGGLWMAKEDLFVERIVAEMTQADGNLTTVFGGRRFGEEMLGSLGPDLQVIVARQLFPADAKLPAPTIKLPAFALVARLKEPAKVQRQLKVSYQSLIGFLNVIAGQNGAPQLEMTDEQRPGGRLVRATFDPGDESGKRSKNDFVYNFSPSIAFAGDRFIVASTHELAAELLDLAAAADQNPAAVQRNANENALVQLDATAIRDILTDNREQLISRNMLDKGHDRAAAEQEVGLLLTAISVLDRVELRLLADPQQVQIDFEIRFAKAP